MKKLFILACMLVLFVCGAHAQQGKQAFGFHLGYGTEIESVGIGVKYQYNILDALRLEPSVDYFFKNDLSASCYKNRKETTFRGKRKPSLATG